MLLSPRESPGACLCLIWQCAFSISQATKKASRSTKSHLRATEGQRVRLSLGILCNGGDLRAQQVQAACQGSQRSLQCQAGLYYLIQAGKHGLRTYIISQTRCQSPIGLLGS